MPADDPGQELTPGNVQGWMARFRAAAQANPSSPLNMAKRDADDVKGWAQDLGERAANNPNAALHTPMHHADNLAAPDAHAPEPDAPPPVNPNDPVVAPGPQSLPMMGGGGGGGGGTPGLTKVEEIVQRGAGLGPRSQAAGDAFAGATNNYMRQMAQVPDWQAQTAQRENTIRQDYEANARKENYEIESRQRNEMQAAEHARWKAQDAYEHAPSNIHDLLDKGPANAIIMTIGAAMGGFAQAFTGHNSFMETIDKGLASQLGKAKSLLDLSQEQVDKLSTKQKEEREAALKKQQDLMAAAIKKVGQMAAENPNNPVAQAEAAKMQAEGAAKLFEISGKIDEASRDRTTEKHVYGGKGGGAGAGALSKQDLEGAKYISEQQTKLGLPGLEASMAAVEGDLASGAGSGVYNQTKNAASKAGGFTGFLAGKAADAIADTSTKTSYTHAQDLLNQLVKMRSGGQVSDDEYNRYQAMFLSGDPGQIREAISMLRKQVNGIRAGIYAGATEGGQASYDKEFARRQGIQGTLPSRVAQPQSPNSKPVGQ